MYKLFIALSITIILSLSLLLCISCQTKPGDPISPGRTVDSGVSPSPATSQGNQLSDIEVGPDAVSLIVRLSGTPENLYTDTIDFADSMFPQIRILSDKVKNIYRANRGKEATTSVQAEITPLVNQIISLKKSRASYVTSILHTKLDTIQRDAARAIESIPQTRVAAYDLILNSLIVQSCPSNIYAIGQIPGVIDVTEDFQALPVTDTTAQALKLRPPGYPQTVWDKGFHGEGVSVMALDTGVTPHPAFDGLDLVSSVFPNGATGCVSTDSGDHGTHSCGVIASQDKTYRGLAYGINTYYNAKMCDGYDGFQALQDAYNWAMIGGSGFNEAQVLNFSMVFTYNCSQIDGLDILSEFVDNTVDLYDVIWSLGAGNQGVGCDGGQIRDKPGTSYNGLAIVAAEDHESALRDDDTYWTGSKYGPNSGPGGVEERIKPDIMTMTNATSPSAGGGFSAFGGTSCAAPHYSGFAAVMISAGVTSTLELRALTFATAEDYAKDPAGPGPDIYSGFGYADAWNAYAHIADTYSGEFTPTDNEEKFRIAKVHAGDRVVLVYNKHKATGSYKLSNLDIVVFDKITGDILHETTKQYENREYIQFDASDEGKDVIVEAVATILASGLSKEKWAISANTVMDPYSDKDPKAPVLSNPASGYVYTLGDNLTFNWTPAVGTNPSAYWVDVWVDAVHFQLLPVGGLNMGLATQLSIPSKFVEMNIRDGVWEWSVASAIGSKKYWSERNYIYKSTAPMLLTPVHNGKVPASTVFDWADSPGTLNYVAKITGIKPGDVPLYLPLNSTSSEFLLKQAMFNLLKSGKTYTWAVAATAQSGNLSPTDPTLSKLSYSIPWNFEKQE
jgi:hypothetical protein